MERIAQNIKVCTYVLSILVTIQSKTVTNNSLLI